ncbi:MAG: SDR family oxidoreductase [Cytophagales bacterium]|nr:SDR family oxidoreductase [Rhizobacter sp.]
MSSPSPSPSISPSLAVVTGAGSGIGLALTHALLARGCEVVAIDRHTDTLAPRAHRVALDVRDATGMARLAETFAGRPVSHVFANAGIGGMPADVLTCTDTAWQWVWDVNVMGALRTLRLWWPHLRAGRGKAVATLSAAALQSFPGAAPYRATKAALLSALEGLHYESASSGVSVHALCPGMVRTDIGDLQRYDEFAALKPHLSPQPNPFAAHVAQAMKTAEPAAAFAERVLDGLAAGAPFYWFTHPETRNWVEGRHRAIMDGRKPFSDFGAPA